MQLEQEEPKWTKRLNFTKEGKLRGTLNNTLLILQNEPLKKGRIKLNKVTGRIELWSEAGDVVEVNDAEVSRIRCSLSQNMKCETSANNIWDALIHIASNNSYDPIRDELNRCAEEWDGQSRIDSWLVDYCGAEGDPDYLRAVGSKFFLGAAARGLDPGIKNDTMLILEGVQGGKKSSTLRRISMGFFTDSVKGVTSKDDLALMNQNLIVELAELEALRELPPQAKKAAISSQVDEYRSPYGRTSEKHPRRFVFVGTTNDVEYLRDATGNRRFWPVKTTNIQPPSEQEIRQLWGEAVVRYRRGIAEGIEDLWWLSSAEEELAVKEQKMRFAIDERSIQVEEYLSDRWKRGVEFSEMMRSVFDLSSSKGRREQAELKRMLTSLGYETKQWTLAGDKKRFIVPADLKKPTVEMHKARKEYKEKNAGGLSEL